MCTDDSGFFVEYAAGKTENGTVYQQQLFRLTLFIREQN